MTKITVEELKNIQDFKVKYDQISLALGRNELQSKLLNNDNQSLHNQYNDLVKQEQVLHDEIVKKYGPGNLNFQTGEYTPVDVPQVDAAGQAKVNAKLEDAEIATENPSEKS